MMKKSEKLLQLALGIGLFATVLLSQGCKKSFLNVSPAGSTTAATFYKTQDDATAAVNGMYANLPRVDKYRFCADSC